MFDLYQSFKSYVNTYLGGWYRPSTDFLYACNDISIKFWIKWTGEAEKSQQAKDNLFPFLVSKNCKVDQNGPYGTFTPPTDYERFATARVIVVEDKCLTDKNLNKIEGFNTDEQMTEDYYNNVKQFTATMVDDQKWGAANEHLTKKPTIKSPIVRLVNGKFQVSPRQVSVVVLDYYIKPSLATFGYTVTPPDFVNGTGDVMVPSTGNKPLPWAATLRDEFLIALGERYSLFTRDNFVAQINQQIKQTA